MSLSILCIEAVCYSKTPHRAVAGEEFCFSPLRAYLLMPKMSLSHVLMSSSQGAAATTQPHA